MRRRPAPSGCSQSREGSRQQTAYEEITANLPSALAMSQEPFAVASGSSAHLDANRYTHFTDEETEAQIG